MPSLQTALPPELANNVIRVKYLIPDFHGFNCSFTVNVFDELNILQHNTELLVNMVRQQFKRNKHETDPEKIQKLKDDAARGLINHILYEAERLSGRRASNNVSSDF
ncbi:hypothetical protein SADUNF_Sadunf08G0080400 [Salix dunnii]|uniref:Complex 1 LYR protein domain-containing protein n=1 Tax=Salix dunnii TaxID=1413687 RepID=A0A835JVR0_9ROSI|nr:hypothetical protein SADUNF_Sadunf08G0080400 [Salix dunnii]